MNYRKSFVIEPGAKVRLSKIDAGFKDKDNESHKHATAEIQKHLERFAQRLDDPRRRWKISEADYSERKLWPDYMKAYEEAMERTSTKRALWYVIPSDHKWFRNLAISEILADTLEDMDLKLPPTHVDIADIRRKYHAATAYQARRDHQPSRAPAREIDASPILVSEGK